VSPVSSAPEREGCGPTLAFLAIVLAVLMAGACWLYWSRLSNEKAARNFAREMAEHLATQLDRKFLDTHMAPEREAHYPPSYRDRFIDNLRSLGKPSDPATIEGNVTFDSYIFDPRGSFTAHLNYASGPAQISYAFSRPKGWWQIDGLNLSWTVPHSQPSPSPSAAPRASASPTPAASR